MDLCLIVPLVNNFVFQCLIVQFQRLSLILHKILLIKQYGKDFNVLVAGYITKGENAKETLIREIKEEVNLNVVDYTYNDNEYYQPSNTLMHNYAVVVDSEDFKLTNEVDEAHWYSIEEERKEIKQGSLAHSFLERYLKKQH